MNTQTLPEASHHLRRRVGDTPLVRAPKLAKSVGLNDLWLKMEGANPTGTQKDRVARLELADAVSKGHDSITVASCGNFGVAIAHAAFTHRLACTVFVPEDFTGERVTTMESLGASVERTAGMYEDAVAASREHAHKTGAYDANPGGSNTLRTMVGYSTISKEIVTRLGHAPTAVGVPIGNGSTLAGVHLGFRTQWGQGKADEVPALFGGTSRANNPLPVAMDRGVETVGALDPRSITETEINEPLVNWDALDGQACLDAIRDSGGHAYGHDDDEIATLHDALLEDGIEAHPASLTAVAALVAGVRDGRIPADATMVAVMTSGRPSIVVEEMQDIDLEDFIPRLNEWLGRFGDPEVEVTEAVRAAIAGGHILAARENDHDLGYLVLTPMELDTFFPKFHLSYVAVDPATRGRGLGTILLEDAIRITGGDLSLHVETDNEPAIRLYEKFGFQRKYYRMLYKGNRTTDVDPAGGVNPVAAGADPDGS